MSVRSLLLAACLLSGSWTASRAQDYAYIANLGSDTVSVISTATNTVRATIPVGGAPDGVAVTPDGSKAYIANFDDGTVSVIDARTNTVVASIAVGSDPKYLAITPDGSKLYVTDDGPVSVISTATNTVTATISLTAIAVAVAPDGRKAYFANDNNISVVDTATDAVLTTIPVGVAPFDVALTPDGTRAYVANFVSNNVSVISTVTNTVLATIQGLDQPSNVAITPDGGIAYVVNQGGSNTVSAISTATNKIVATIAVGNLPAGVALTRDGSLAYVPNFYDGTVSVIATATNQVLKTIAVGSLPNDLGKFIGPIPTSPPAAALSALKNLFVAQQQYFVFDSEGSGNPQLNHLHVTQLDTTTGAFAGEIFAPVVPPFIVPQQAVAVTGTVTVIPDVLNAGLSFELADFYQIAFSWHFAGSALSCQTETATYTGAIMFLGYEGSGKMHATIAGSVLAETGGCAVSGIHFGPLPFSGQLTK